MDELEFNRALNESAQLLRQNRPQEAEEKLLPLYATTPEHPDVLINLSGAYILQRKWDKAVRLLNEGAKSNPNNAMLWMNLGAAQLGRLETAGPQQQQRAIEAYQRALQVNPETPNAHYHLGLIYKERGELMRAAAFFQRALEVDPADRDARYWLDRLPAMGQDKEPLQDDAASKLVDAVEDVLEAKLEDDLKEMLEEILGDESGDEAQGDTKDDAKDDPVQ